MPRQLKLNFSASTQVGRPINADKAPDSASLSRETALPIASISRVPLTPLSSQSSTTPLALSQTAMNSSFELPDSTDWLTTSLPAFEPLEAALRCEVCKEFYDNPVITSCSHTFCSLCIRRCITTDGKCPTCKTANQADKLVPNMVVREIVHKFQDARPKAFELAKKAKDDRDDSNTTRECKRKLDETDIEEGELTRQTRSRQTRSRSQRGNGPDNMPVEVPDSEDEGDEEFVPEEGMVNCPICNESMKEVHVWRHMESDCTGEQKSAGGHSTRSRANKAFSTPLQSRQKADTPPPTRLSGLNYPLIKESALKKKLQELGIPSWGKKDLLIKRHTEWLHLWNSNCDSLKDWKSKRELLKELDEWENTRGGKANVTESKFMRKDFDGQAHANTHKNQFDDLIANARKKRATPKEEDKKEEMQMDETREHSTEPQAEQQSTVEVSRPYEGNESALATIREKVEQTNRNDFARQSLSRETSTISKTSTSSMGGEAKVASEEQLGMQNPFGSPTRKMHMFALPEDPIVDVEQSTAVQ